MLNMQFAGNLTKEPEVKQSKNNKAYTRFTVAVTIDSKDSNGKYKTAFVNCMAGGRLGENIAKYFHKGDQIICFGSLFDSRAWKGNNEELHADISVTVNNFEFGRKSNNNNTINSNSESNNDNNELEADDIPF